MKWNEDIERTEMNRNDLIFRDQICVDWGSRRQDLMWSQALDLLLPGTQRQFLQARLGLQSLPWSAAYRAEVPPLQDLTAETSKMFTVQ